MKQAEQVLMNSGDWIRIGIATGWLKEAAWWQRKTPAEKAYFQSQKDREQQMLSSLRYVENYANLVQQMAGLLNEISTSLESNSGIFTFLESIPNGRPLAEQLRGIDGTTKTFQTASKFIRDALQHIIRTGQMPDGLTPPHSVQETPAQPQEAPAPSLFEEPQPAPAEAQPAETASEVTLDKLPEFLKNPNYKLVYQRPKDGQQYPVVIRRPPAAEDKIILVSTPKINKGAPFPVDTKNLAIVQAKP